MIDQIERRIADAAPVLSGIVGAPGLSGRFRAVNMAACSVNAGEVM